MAFLPFPHPDPAFSAGTSQRGENRRRNRVWPVFLPFAGCRTRCVYCAQTLQTGTPHRPLAEAHRTLAQDLSAALASGTAPLELAFYGGTFTALPDPWPERFLALADEFRQAGLITRIRCSTRPDAVSPESLARLKSQGLSLVELGIQSFDDAVLEASRRGYSGEEARNACATVRDAGLGLGIQLLPGLPARGRLCMSGETLEKDAEAAAGERPECVRLYPCLVIRGTELARMYQAGVYEPWSLDDAVRRTAGAVRTFWAAGIPVIRTGLAQEEGLAEGIVAGPWHEAFGARVRARVLLEYVREILSGEGGAEPLQLRVPRRVRGEIFGHRNELLAEYERCGLGRDRIRVEDRDDFLLESGE